MPQKRADSHVTRKPVCQPHTGPRSIVDLSAFSPEKETDFAMGRGPAWGLCNLTGLRATCESALFLE